MAVSSSVHFDLDPFNTAFAAEHDDHIKLFMDQYLLSAAAISPDHYSPSTFTVDELSTHHPNRGHGPESVSFSHDSIGTSSVVESPCGDNSFALHASNTPSPDQPMSSSSLSPSPARKAPIPSEPEPELSPNSSPRKTAENKPKGKKTTRKRKGRTFAMERNRLAATKSRQKSKSATDALEATCSELDEKYQTLKGQHNDLSQLCLQLKSEILRHASCGDPNIETWVTDEAGSFVKQMGRP